MKKPGIKISVATKMVLFSLILITVSTATITVLMYRKAATSLETQLGIELLRIANSTAPLIKGDLLEESFF